MLNKFSRTALATAIMLNLSASYLSIAYSAAPNTDEVARLSTLESSFKDFNDISAYAKKAVLRLELLGLFSGDSYFYPQQKADRLFARQILGTLQDPGKAELSYYDAKNLITQHLINNIHNETVSFEGFLSIKDWSDDELISREELAYMVAQARQIDSIETGDSIHNPAIASSGPLLGPTVFQSGSDENGAVYDGSTVSLYHRAKDTLNTSFKENPVFTLQVHPEVFKSVSVGGIAVETLQDLSAQLEVELTDGSLHRTPLNSMIPFSIHGADGKAADVRIEDGLLVLVDDLLGNVDSFNLNVHEFNVQETVNRMQSQSYYNGDKTDEQVLSVVSDELLKKGFSLGDQRLCYTI